MYFDAALPVVVDLATIIFGDSVFNKNLVLRDASGRLTLILRDRFAQKNRKRFDKKVSETLGRYVLIPSATPDELFDPSLNDDGDVIYERVKVNNAIVEVGIVDRRIVGEDWNRPHFETAVKDIPVVTFFSCKGGVGRSTALAVAAAAFAEMNKNVLIFDFDLEAPGLGSLFLNAEEMPDFGALDYFVENGLGGVDDSFLTNCVAPSPLTSGRGLVEVVPAVGRVGQAHPQNVIPKLGRAFLADTDGQGGTLTFLDQTRSLVSSMAQRRRYDVVLVDARAGMSESAAASVIGLGGHVLFFGVDTPQTFEAYRYLFSFLGRFVSLDQGDWRYGMRMIHAKAARGEEAFRRFRDRSQELFSSYLYEEADSEDVDAYNYDFDDPEAPHFAWPILYDADFSEFDPRHRQEQLTRAFYDRSFGLFVERLAAWTIPRKDNHGA